MAATDALPNTLKSITETKLKELSKQQALFESRKAAIYEEAARQTTLDDRVRVLLEGVTRIKGFPDDGLDTTDKEDDAVFRSDGLRASARHVYWNIRRDLVQKRYDSSISDARLKQSEKELRQQLDFISAKHNHALFFNRLVTEWLTNSRSPVPEIAHDNSMDGSYEQLERKEAHEQRTQWEALVFEPRKADKVEIERYLTKLFKHSRLSEQALKDLRRQVKLSSKEFLTKDDHFTLDTLKWIIKGVISKDILSGDKVAILREFLRNDAVAQEVADVLNVRMAQIDTWSWSCSPIPVEMRRHLNGKYRAYMDEDILDAMFLHYIGVKWSIRFKELFTVALRSHAWKPQSKKIPKSDIERRKYFLYENGRECRDEHNIVGARKNSFLEDYFMCQLPIDADSVPVYGEDGDPGYQTKSFMDLKHSLLHLVMAEIWLNKALYGEVTVVQSDFRWFGPSLSHTTLLSVLEFFHMPPVWIEFFRRFLEAPLRFVQDGENGPIRIRKNGVPLSHAISDCLGEVLLFCLDFSVNQYADGLLLYRLHDDFWFWGQEQTCAKAWRAINDFCAVMGLVINDEKSGTARLYGGKRRFTSDIETDSDLAKTETGRPSKIPKFEPSPLPQGDIRWGFLKLDEGIGRFIVDESQIDVHIQELRRQLAACKSIFSWVQAWNTYMARFISNNFGKPALCLGRPHIEMVLSTLKRIESELFAVDGGSASPGSVADHLRLAISKNFDIADLPDGFFYFPEEYGGLALTNPFVSLISMREGLKTTPERILQNAFIAEEKEYATAKEKYESQGPNQTSLTVFGSDSPSMRVSTPTNEFMSLEEFMRYSESTSYLLKNAYKCLLDQPTEVPAAFTPELQNAVSKNEAMKSLPAAWSAMSSYSKSIVELYHAEMISKYGGLAAVEDKTLPLGVVKILKQEKDGRFFTVFSNLIYHLCSDLDSLRYSTRRVLQDFQNDGVKYLELRTTPRESQEHGVSKEQYISTVLDVIEEFNSDEMSTYLILSVDRTKSAANAMEVVDLAIKYQHRGVVAVELGGDPSRGDVSVFREAFRKAKEHGLHITLHFAEIASSRPGELEALLSFQPERLGHVIHVPDGFAEEIARRKLALELCLSCNVHAKLIQGGFPDHHFGYWRHQHCPVILCRKTDDVGFFCSPLSNEYLLAAEHFKLDRSMILDLCKRAVPAIFGGKAEEDRLYELISHFEEQLQ
ncbi:RT-like superfamily and adenosine deaminase domain-containing protein [Emydomyces testavorans]|uniref:RT-like superfamily and adenosine deaminase domain-containing protein n=1 Tax=Emydomyces testavorans TaxID=2070801 RepID=A0AAF0DDT0_9EURO|nr:RT-like superfamily and adenosine deaminase domain-containing protein [Emydomyces testavorans]